MMTTRRCRSFNKQGRLIKSTVIGLLFLVPIVSSANLASGDALRELNRLSSTLSKMQHGYYSNEEWADAMDKVRLYQREVQQQGQNNLSFRAGLLLADIQVHARKNPEDALAELDMILVQTDQVEARWIRKAYLLKAEILADLGDEQGVSKLVDQYRKSPWYEDELPPVRGGTGPNDPVRIARPGVQEASSITVTALESFRKQARVSPGNYFPLTAARTRAGQTVKFRNIGQDYIVLLFWSAGWPSWRRVADEWIQMSIQPDLPVQIYGVCVGPDSNEQINRLRMRGAGWPELADARRLASLFAVQSQVTAVVVEPGGLILGRVQRVQDATKLMRTSMLREPGDGNVELSNE